MGKQGREKAPDSDSFHTLPVYTRPKLNAHKTSFEGLATFNLNRVSTGKVCPKIF